MSKNAEKKTLNQLTLFAGESHVSQPVLPGSEEARKTTVGSGLRLLELLKNSSHVGLSLKTLLGYCLSSKELYSTKCYLTWKIRATKQGRLIYQLAVSMPPTDDIESSLLPTPYAWDAQRGPSSQPYNPKSKSQKDRILPNYVKWWPTPTRGDAHLSSTPEVAQRRIDEGKETLSRRVQMWSTPQKADADVGAIPAKNIVKKGNVLRKIDSKGVDHSLGLAREVQMWPTPRSGKTTSENPETWMKRQEEGKVSTPPLGMAVQMFRTPNQRDWKGQSSKGWREREVGDKTPTLPDQIGGQLNPQFVSWLMGFPIDWCDLEDEPQEEYPTESTNLEHSETP